MPAAAVIPAPLAYIKVVAVKKLVVEISLVFHHSLPFKGPTIRAESALTSRHLFYDSCAWLR